MTKRRRGSPLGHRDGPLDGRERAEARVEQLIRSLSRVDLPLRGGWLMRPEGELRGVRRLAVRSAAAAGREDLLDDAHEVVERMYRVRQRDVDYSLAAVASVTSAQDRAICQAAILDLATAAVMEDLLPLADLELLRADGERLLRSFRGFPPST